MMPKVRRPISEDHSDAMGARRMSHGAAIPKEGRGADSSKSLLG
jgi:hypothetical protein